jgi:hypothetical protein
MAGLENVPMKNAFNTRAVFLPRWQGTFAYYFKPFNTREQHYSCFECGKEIGIYTRAWKPTGLSLTTILGIHRPRLCSSCVARYGKTQKELDTEIETRRNAMILAVKEERHAC